jgi:tRNA nucleotidyltransferase (CCA-adding enzyme)
VRDALLGRAPKDIDLVVAGDALVLAEELGEVGEVHDRFGTVAVAVGGATVNVAMARTERYPAPGALPEVQPGGLQEDLGRRDFTVNAIAIDLGGTVHAVPGAEADLASGLLRVLHERSFVDDPTRLWRLARYAARLGFGIDGETERLARAAVAGGALATVNGPRLGNELLLAVGEPDPVAALAAAWELKLIAARPPRRRIADALALLPEDGHRGLLALAASSAGPADRVRAWLDEWGIPARERDVVVAAASEAEGLATQLVAAERPSAVARAARGRPVEEVALAGAMGAATPARSWLGELRHVRLEISGDDLLAAGVPQGPEIGQRLDRALAARLDGEAVGREAELAVALA